MQEMWVRSLGREDPLEKEMATHSSILDQTTVHGVTKSWTWLSDQTITAPWTPSLRPQGPQTGAAVSTTGQSSFMTWANPAGTPVMRLCLRLSHMTGPRRWAWGQEAAGPQQAWDQLWVRGRRQKPGQRRGTKGWRCKVKLNGKGVKTLESELIRNRQRSAGLSVSGEGLWASPSAGWGACKTNTAWAGRGYTGLGTGRGIHCSQCRVPS